jgi:hypothetical protein
MSLNFVCLSPHFPEHFRHFWRQLKTQGVHILGISDSSWEALGPEIQDLLHAYYRVEDMHDRSQLEAACRHFIQEQGPIWRLESHNEYWLETDAHLRSCFDISGPNLNNIALLKSKERMKAIYRQAGIPVAEGQKISSPEACRAFIARTGFPVVVKPDIGVGADRTWKLSTEQDLEAFLPHCAEASWLIEEFIEGTLYSYDGLTDITGRILFSTAQRFSHGIMDIVNQDLDLYHLVLPECPPALAALGQQTVAAFQIQERFFHFEFFQRPDQRWVALEVNIRPPGGLSLDMINFAHSLDLYQAYADMLIGGQWKQTAHVPQAVGYIGRKNRTYQLNDAEVLTRFGTHILHHQPMADIFYPVMGNRGFVVKAADPNQIQAMAAEIQARA